MRLSDIFGSGKSGGGGRDGRSVQDKQRKDAEPGRSHHPHTGILEMPPTERRGTQQWHCHARTTEGRGEEGGGRGEGRGGKSTFEVRVRAGKKKKERKKENTCVE